MATDRPGGASRLRERRLLLNPISVVAASVAAFLATLTLLTAKLTAGHDPAVGGIASVARGAATGGGPLTTRASGAALGAAQPQGSTAAPLVTASSGGASTSGGDDA